MNRALGLWHRLRRAAMAGRAWGSQHTAFCVSAAVHLLLFVILSLIITGRTGGVPFHLETAWSESLTPLEAIELEEMAPPVKTADLPGGGASGGEATAVWFSSAALTTPDVEAYASLQPVETIAFDAGMLEEIGPGAYKYTGAGGAGERSGRGNGRGGFFGSRPEGTRFAYVVDASRSMNHPHNSEAGTRFKRLQIELVDSVASLGESDSFIIIFFNDGAMPMPGRTMQPATLANRKKYLNWSSRKFAGGHTDPRGALSLALRQNPDVIYFLTDGEFRPYVVRWLREVIQSRTAIHTFAFGNRDAEHILKALAAANGGEYHFVP